jgi:putative tryptophan/tyrosine transport system substrate-binding protein
MVGLVKKCVVVLTLGLMVSLGGCKEKAEFTIGINQFVAHPALDRAREGFMAGLESRGFKEGEQVSFDYQNAAANTSQASLISQTFVSNKVDLIFAIATPSAQASKGATEESQIPVLFSAVTDGVTAGLVDSNEVPGGNVSGTSDMSPMNRQFALIKSVLGDKQNIGVLYSTGEVNSVVQVDIIKEEAKVDEHHLVVKGVTSNQELLDALTLIIDDVVALLIPTDNLMATNIELIVETAKEKGVPVFGTEAAMVETGGALMTEGIDYYTLGFQAGLMAADVLEGKADISTLPVQHILESELELVINLDTARALGITIPEALLERARLIESGE